MGRRGVASLGKKRNIRSVRRPSVRAMTISTPRVFSPPPSVMSADVLERRHRDAAVVDDAALVSYEAKWQRKLRRLQQAYPARWRVPGLSDEEVRDILTLRLIEAVRARSFEHDELCPGKEWGFLIVQEE